MIPSSLSYPSQFHPSQQTRQVLPVLRYSYPSFGRLNKEKPPNQAGEKIDKGHWIYAPAAKILSFLYLHPNRIQKVVPLSLFLYLDRKTFKKIASYREVNFKTLDNIPLKGYWLQANGRKSNKTIILGHGYYANAFMMYPLAESLRKHGWNVFLFDFRAHGQSHGKNTSIGFHEGKDVAAAITEVKRQFPAFSKHLFYLGHSMGAAAVMMAPKSLEKFPNTLEFMDNALEGIILDSPYLYIKPTENPFVTQWSSYRPASKIMQRLWKPVQLKIAHILQQIVLRYEQDIKTTMDLPFQLDNMRPLMFFKNSPLSQKPILVLHGKEDQWTAFKQGEAVYQGLKKSGKNPIRFVVLNANHFATDWKPLKHKQYKTILRDRRNYLQNLFQFLP